MTLAQMTRMTKVIRALRALRVTLMKRKGKRKKRVDHEALERKRPAPRQRTRSPRQALRLVLQRAEQADGVEIAGYWFGVEP